MTQNRCLLEPFQIFQRRNGEFELSPFWLHYLIGIYSLFNKALDCAKICSLPSSVKPLFSALSILARIQSIWTCCFLACLIKSFTSSLLLAYSFLSTWSFSHSSLGSVNDMLCLAIISFLV